MPHYDGPVFHRQPQEKAPARPVPHAQRGQSAQLQKPRASLAVAPMDALATPASVAKRPQAEQVDYAAIIQALTKTPDQLYLLAPDRDLALDAAPTLGETPRDESPNAPVPPAATTTEAQSLGQPSQTERQPLPNDPQPAPHAAGSTARAAAAEPAQQQSALVIPQAEPAAGPDSLERAKAADQTPSGRDAAPPAAPISQPHPKGTAAASMQRARTASATGYQLPPLALLKDPVQADTVSQRQWVADQTAKLDAALANFNVEAQVVANTVGPTVTQFQLKLAPGVKVSKITNLQDDLKLALAARDIRIEAPIPGHSTVGIEIPNLKPRPVMLKEVLAAPAFQTATAPLTVALGVNLFGQPVVANLAKMPHALIAGATGAGKSVFINSLIISLLFKATPQQVRLLLIDPKAVELAVYDGLPHLLAPVVSDPKSASAALKWVVDEMERRYEKLAAAHTRSLAQFNAQARAHGHPSLMMPSIVVIIDELADLMLVAASEIQDDIARITAKARAAGIHLIVATQRPSVDVITGTIKNNIPTRIAFMVASQVDSRTIIDHAGAENLLGRGDMLYLGNGASQPVRLQGAFIDAELEAVTAFVRDQEPPQYLFDPHQLVKKAQAIEAQDDLFPQVLKYVATVPTVSTSALQRQFSIGYNRAAKLVDELATRHYISAQNGAKPREVYLNKEDLPAPKSVG